MKNMKPGLFTILVLNTLFAQAIDWGVYQQAKQLEKENRCDEAIAVYEKASDKATKDADDQFYMLNAIKIAQAAKDNDRAFKLAERVKNPERRAFVLMSLYKPEELIVKYKDIDFMNWPEDIRAEAYKNRGSAYNLIRNYKDALADFEKALSVPGGSHVVTGTAASTAGDIYLLQIKDELKAEEMYRKALAATNAGYAWRNEALLKLTDLLLKNKKNKEALALYENIDTKKIDIPYWKVALACGYSRALAANGEKVKALEQLNIALQTESKPEAKKQIQLEIDKVTENMLD